MSAYIQVGKRVGGCGRYHGRYIAWNCRWIFCELNKTQKNKKTKIIKKQKNKKTNRKVTRQKQYKFYLPVGTLILLGASEGTTVGVWVGAVVGARLGARLGAILGDCVGDTEGDCDGTRLGASDGAALG